MSPEVFFFGLEFVNRVVAVAAERDRFVHLLAGEVLFEPLVAVAGTWDQVVFGGSLFRRAVAKQASWQLVHCVTAV